MSAYPSEGIEDCVDLHRAPWDSKVQVAEGYRGISNPYCLACGSLLGFQSSWPIAHVSGLSSVNHMTAI